MHGPENRPRRGAGRYAILLLLVALALIVGCKKDEDSDSTTPPPASPPRRVRGEGVAEPLEPYRLAHPRRRSRPPRPGRGSGGGASTGSRCERRRPSRPRRGSGGGASTGPGSERRRPARPWRGSGGGTSAGPGCERRGPPRSGSNASRRSGARPGRTPRRGAKPIPVKAVKPPVHEDYGLPYTELEKRTKLQQFADVYGVPVTWVKEKDWNGKIIEWAVFHDDKWGNVKIPVALVMDGPYLTLLKPYFRFYPLTEFRKGIRKIRIGGSCPRGHQIRQAEKDKMEAAEKAAAEAAAAPATPAPGGPGRGGGGPGSPGWTGPRRSWGGV